jgi:hypothetical protein
MKSLTQILAAVLALTAAGCSSDPAEQAASKVPVATASAGGLQVDLLSTGALETGWTPLYFKVSTAAGQPVTDADVTFEPMMAMTPSGMNHGTPVGAPALGSDGVYRGYANFIMASGASGSWSAKVGVTRPGSARVDVPFPQLVVHESGRATSFSYFDPDTATTTKYFASIGFPAGVGVGANPLVVTLHAKAAMGFSAVNDAAVTVFPWMDMGHSSPGNVDPVFVSTGLYEGKLDFTMRGTWKTTVTIQRGGTTLGAPQFVTTL